ncbi:MAG: 5'-methylthioadenosine/adenosylhomocysteine nucleosidase [Bacteroidota bacterium]
MKIRIGIMGAMPEEIEGLVPHVHNKVENIFGQRKYTTGTLSGVEVVVVFSRWGKVAAASTAATLIHKFQITHLLFSGVAGALSSKLNLADVVIAENLIQHDLDARPFMPKFEIPLLGKTQIQTNSKLNRVMENVCQSLQFNYHKGLVASGDQFFQSNEQKEAVTQAFPQVLCVEMEGAAVAQVCFEHEIPFSVIRIISDTANESAAHDFQEFIRNVSAVKLDQIILETINKLGADSSFIQ